MNKLFLKKIFVAFLVGFGGYLLPIIANLGPAANAGAMKAVWASALSGAVMAGLRALLAFSPINLVPSDAEQTLGGSTPAAPAPPPAATKTSTKKST